MGLIADFQQIIKELKHKRRDEPVRNLCPRCRSIKIFISSGFDTYPRMYGITPKQFVCHDCGYKGPIVLEQIVEEST